MIIFQDLLFLFFLFLLFFFLFIVIFLICWCLFTALFLTLRSLCITGFLAWPLTKPLGKLLGWPLGPFLILLFPDSIKRLGSDNLPASFVQLLPVIIGSGVYSAFILGVHADHWWVLSNKGPGIKTLLQGLLSELGLLSFLQFLQVKFLSKLPLFIVIFVCFKLNNDVEDLSSLSLELIRVHGFKLQGLQSDAEGNLLLLLELLLGLCHFPTGISTTTTSNRLLLISTSSCFLGFKHFLSLCFSFFKLFLLFFLFLLLLVELLFLFSSNFFPFCLLFLQLLQLL